MVQGHSLITSFITFGISILSFALGFCIFARPEKMIELQKRFYLLINWKIEPVSMKKEIRNTKAMGLFLMVFVTAVCCYLWFG